MIRKYSLSRTQKDNILAAYAPHRQGGGAGTPGCFDCPESRPQCVQFDHRVPFASYGPDYPANRAPRCANCNAAKGTSPESEHQKKISDAATVSLAAIENGATAARTWNGRPILTDAGEMTKERGRYFTDRFGLNVVLQSIDDLARWEARQKGPGSTMMYLALGEESMLFRFCKSRRRFDDEDKLR